MESFPAFHDPAKFPAFSGIPQAAPDPNVVAESAHKKGPELLSPYYLIGTMSENMTLGTNPTFICKDRNMTPFAVTIKLDSRPKSEKFDVQSFKKGYTMVIGDAKKYGVKDGKQGFIETTAEKIKNNPKKDMEARFGAKGPGGEDQKGMLADTALRKQIVPTSVERLIEMSSVKDSLSTESGDSTSLKRCQGCSMEKDSDQLSRCQGCEAVWYCNKNCQTKGWSEKGHKTYCKILRAVKGLGGE